MSDAKYLIAVNHPNHYLTRQGSKVIIKISDSPNIDFTTEMLWSFEKITTTIPAESPDKPDIMDEQYIIKSAQSSIDPRQRLILCSDAEIPNSLVDPNHWSLKVTDQFQGKPCLWHKIPIPTGFQLILNQDWILSEAIINDELRPVIAHRSTVAPTTIFITNLALIIGDRNVVVGDGLENAIGQRSSIFNLPYSNINFGDIYGSAYLGGNAKNTNMYVMPYGVAPKEIKGDRLTSDFFVDNFANIKASNDYWSHLTNFAIVILLLLILIMLPNLNKK